MQFFHVLPINKRDICEEIVTGSIKYVRVQEIFSELMMIEGAENYCSCKLPGSRTDLL